MELTAKTNPSPIVAVTITLTIREARRLMFILANSEAQSIINGRTEVGENHERLYERLYAIGVRPDPHGD